MASSFQSARFLQGHAAQRRQTTRDRI